MNDRQYMEKAYLEALKAFRKGEVPVGCVIVRNGKILARAHNLREHRRITTAHAETEAIRKACRKTKEKFLDGSTIYITLEPCLMCTGAIIQARIKRIVYGADEPKFGAVVSTIDIMKDCRLNHRPEITRGLMASESAALLQKFFREIRRTD